MTGIEDNRSSPAVHQEVSAPKHSRAAYGIGALLLAFLVAILVQWKTGAWLDDFSLTGDEPSHFTSSVAVREYLVSGNLSHPLAFAGQYYLHYPKVSFGKWPPVFYLLSGLWFLIVTPSRFSAMLLIALQAAALGYVSFRAASRILSPAVAMLAAVTVVATPIFTLQSTTFMLEIQMGILSMLSLLAFGEVLRRPGWKSNLLFFAAATACVLSKANGWAVFLGAGFGCLCFWHVLRARWASLAGLFAAVFAASVPFYIVFVHAMADGNASSRPALWFTLQAVPSYLNSSLYAVGFGVSLFFVVRLAMLVFKRQPMDEKRPWIVLLFTWTAGVFLFQIVVPASFEIRHLAMAFPCVVLLAFSGVTQTVERFGSKAVLAASATLLLITIPWNMPFRSSDVFRAAAPEIIRALSQNQNRAVLISSDDLAEGRMVASAAASHPAGDYYFVRATKLLADANWDARDYHLLAATPQEILKRLDSVPIGYVAVHTTGRDDFAHHRLLVETLSLAPEKWRPVKKFQGSPLSSNPRETLVLYENAAAAGHPVASLEISLERKLGFSVALPGQKPAK